MKSRKQSHHDFSRMKIGLRDTCCMSNISAVWSGTKITVSRRYRTCRTLAQIRGTCRQLLASPHDSTEILRPRRITQWKRSEKSFPLRAGSDWARVPSNAPSLRKSCIKAKVRRRPVGEGRCPRWATLADSISFCRGFHTASMPRADLSSAMLYLPRSELVGSFLTIHTG